MGLKKTPVKQPAQTTKAAEPEISAEEEVVQEVEAEEEEVIQEAEVQKAAEPEAEVKTKSTEVVASHTQSGALAQVESGKFENRMAEKGFEGLDMGFYSFTVIKLGPEGVFQKADDDEELGKELVCQILQSRPKWAYGVKHDQDKNEFSYDRETNPKGENIDDIIAEWKAEDPDAEITEKQYLDVTARILGGDTDEANELEGEVVILSVAPTSVQKFTGYIGKLDFNGKNITQVETVVYVGKKVTKAVKPFYPWAFKTRR
ncbi:MAG: hypothetical protein PVI43_00215 [Candidatus Bathyarchaeota archaeon]|jgi:hypothetical protein